MGDITIREWQIKHAAGEFNSKDCHIMIEAGWFDWFCGDKALHGRMQPFLPIVKKLTSAGKVDINKDYIFFKNNCPVSHPLYDSMSICSMESGDVKFFISYKCPYEKDEEGNIVTWAVSSINDKLPGPDGDWPTLHFSNARQVVEWLNSK